MLCFNFIVMKKKLWELFDSTLNLNAFKWLSKDLFCFHNFSSSTQKYDLHILCSCFLFAYIFMMLCFIPQVSSLNELQMLIKFIFMFINALVCLRTLLFYTVGSSSCSSSWCINAVKTDSMNKKYLIVPHSSFCTRGNTKNFNIFKFTHINNNSGKWKSFLLRTLCGREAIKFTRSSIEL